MNGFTTRRFSYKHVPELITTKYTIHRPPNPSRTSASNSTPADDDTSATATNPAQPVQPKGSLVLKTYDPESGTCLKFKTDKAAEVGRLVASLGKLGRYSCGLRPRIDAEDGDVVPESVPPDSQVIEERGTGVQKEEAKAGNSGQKADTAGQETKGGTTTGTVGKKKKKGKR